MGQVQKLADISQQSHVDVTGCNSIPPSRICQDPEYVGMGGLWRATGVCAQKWGSKKG